MSSFILFDKLIKQIIYLHVCSQVLVSRTSFCLLLDLINQLQSSSLTSQKSSFADASSLCSLRYEGEERGIQAYYKPSSSPSVHAFLGAGELDRPLDSLWNIICQLSKSHMYNQSVRSVWTRPLDDSTQLGELMCLPSLDPHVVSVQYFTSSGMQKTKFSQEL